MNGKVKSYSSATQYGFIEGAANEIFFFLKTEWHLPIKPKPGLKVEFTPIEVEKGRRATNIQRARRRNDERN